ncbi:diguanylate cyclase [Bacillus sp. SA1-12]|uniref:putative bifunctional diguanylate cyclase/phosphodiesterase n=1 Tax=Bacillus sp. SA1-12 TaxID=1455638 RepID=UPI000627222D|nr:EAL domain-containing protein [Bacillus sp. SA1-12]KKI90789.1 diguanylate cyclase [Bacillus sp. SA1-12]
MSIKKKLPLIFSTLVLCILIANNTLHYIRSKNNLISSNEREISLIVQQLSYLVETAKEGSLYVENIIGRELRTASIAIRNSLPSTHQDVSNDRLKELATELMVSHITLLTKTETDIVGIKSSDPYEINMSTKGWGYWYTAFQQLFSEQPVNVGKGQTLPNYWSGPIEVASSNPDHTDKWGYYYDGKANYIINPYLRDNEVLEYEKRFGPGNVMEEVTKNLEGVLELTVFNPKNFGKEKEVVHLNGNSYIRISAQPIWYGTYLFTNKEKDANYIQAAVKSGKDKRYNQVLKNKHVIKTFVPVDLNSKEPYVIGITYDYDLIQKQLNRELIDYLLSSLVFMILVILISLVFSKSITNPIAMIADHVNMIAQGHFNNRISLNRKDELGHLATNINSLSNDLKTYTDDLKKSQEVIKYQAYHDPLTTLPNRRFVQEKLAEMIHKANLMNGIVGVIFMDIDRFKHINDSMGHKSGDLLLKLISERITNCLPEGISFVARQGGDEFIILLEDTNEQMVCHFAFTIVDQLKQPFELNDREIYIGASCGISFYPAHTNDIDKLIVNADQAMYKAKKQGGNKVVIYDPNEGNTNKERLHIEARLRKAIQDQNIEVYYQPKVQGDTGEIIGAEALARWKDHDHQYVLPSVFIPIAEESGLIQSLFELVLRKSMSRMMEWNKNFLERMSISVNVSAQQFTEPSKFIKSIKLALSDLCFPPELLEIEITEGTLLKNLKETKAALEEISQLGVTISIDDFGTGYSSLSYLSNLPINSLKIDKSFIKEMDENGSNTEIPEGIIHLARSLRLDIIAEGVEKEHQKEYLLNNGCQVMQGYYFYMPLCETEFARIVASR